MRGDARKRVTQPVEGAGVLSDADREALLAPCACGHTINDHGSLAGCWWEDETACECTVSFEAMLAERVATIVARPLIDLLEPIRVAYREVEAAQHERDRLQRWKDEALPVIDGLQELGRALGLRLGTSITGPEAIKAAEAMTDRAIAAEQREADLRAGVEALHSPFGIYDECDHEHTEDDVAAGAAKDIPEVGRTCNLLYIACRECCTDFDGRDYWPTEACANYHDHDHDPAHRCATVALLDRSAS